MDRDQPAEPTLMPEAVIVRTEGRNFGHGCVVTLTEEGMGWDPGADDGARWVPWPLMGGLANRVEGRTAVTDVLALDGSRLGSIVGIVPVEGTGSTLAHVVATFRSDTFVESEGGCIRREVAAAERGTGEDQP